LGVAELVTVKWPLLVVAVWVAVVVLSVPLFASLHSVVKTQQYSLPESSEASVVDEVLKRVSGGSSFGLVIVDGVDLRNSGVLLRLAEWGLVLNDSLVGEGVASRVSGFPVVLAGVFDRVRGLVESNISVGAGRARELFERFRMIDSMYAGLLRNVSGMVAAVDGMVKGVMWADAGLARARGEFERLGSSAVRVARALVALDEGFVNASRGLAGVVSRLNASVVLVSSVDRLCSVLSSNVSRVYSGFRLAFSNASLVHNLARLVAVEWWQASRSYVLLDYFNGSVDLFEKYAYASPMLRAPPPAEAIRYWRLVGGLVERGYDVDNASLRVAVGVVSSRLHVPASIVAVLGSMWLNAAEHQAHGCLSCLYKLADTNASRMSQLRVLRLAEAVAANVSSAASSNPSLYAVRATALMLEMQGLSPNLSMLLARSAARGFVDPRASVLAALDLMASRKPGVMPVKDVLASLLPRFDPLCSGILAQDRRLAVKAASELLGSLGVPGEVLGAAIPLVLKSSITPSMISSKALELISARLEKENPNASMLIPLLKRYDPLGEGRLKSDADLLAGAVADALYEMMVLQGFVMDKSVLEKFVRTVLAGNLTVEEASRQFAFKVVLERVEKEKGRDAARLIGEILQAGDPLAKGVLAGNATRAYEIVVKVAGRQRGVAQPLPFNASVLYQASRNETLLRWLVFTSLRKRVLESVPVEARPLMERYFSVLWARGPGLDAWELWDIVEDALEEELSARMGSRSLAMALADTIVRVARGDISVEAAARSMASLMLTEQIAPRLLNETRGIMVSRSMDSFTVMFTPLGDTREERANNTLKAARILERLLKEHEIGYGRVLATSSDLLLKEVREYARKDVEKTSKISETATFIVLLVILESVFAVLMPYTGIVLGLLVGGAIVYLAARQGIITVDTTAQSIMMTTALGLGADYAAYLTHRFREEIARDWDSRRAAKRALERAGPAIVASMLTVMIGFGSLLLGWDIRFLRGLGETVPITVAATGAASLTLVPALLALLGGRKGFWWPRRPSVERHVGRESRLMRGLHRHHWSVLGVLTLAMIIGGVFYVNFKGSHDMKLMLPQEAESMEAFNKLKKDYMPGISDPVYIVAEFDKTAGKKAAEYLEELIDAVRKIKGVGMVTSSFNTSRSQPAGQQENANTTIIQVMLSLDPYSDEGTRTVKEIHDRVHALAARHGFRVYVGGAPYAVIEMDKVLNDRYYKRILPAAALLMIAVFTLIFGSLPVSVAALIVIMGSAMLGITISTILFQKLLGENIPWFLHIVSMMAVLGVGMDYNSFFLARALEECKREDCRDTERALSRATGAVGLFIIGLALVVSSAYLSMMSASNTALRSMGFTLGVTILLAGTMASYLYTPLVVALLGRRAWWPRGLRKSIEH